MLALSIEKRQTIRLKLQQSIFCFTDTKHIRSWHYTGPTQIVEAPTVVAHLVVATLVEVCLLLYCSLVLHV